MAELTTDERSLLLFLETCAVDHSGVVDTCHMNSTDHAIAARWAIEGFIEFVRIRFHDIEQIAAHGRMRTPTHAVRLSDAAWAAAAAERRARADRTYAKRPWRTINEPAREESEAVALG